MSERWVPIPGYEGLYSTSDGGRIRSDRSRGRIIRPYLTRKGYLRVCLSRGGRSTGASVHRLVALAFLGPSHLEVCHLDHVKTNNVPSNLAYATHAENMRQSIESGLHPNWRRLSPRQVSEIIAELRLGRSQRGIARRFGVSQWAIISIKRGRTWRDHPARLAA